MIKFLETVQTYNDSSWQLTFYFVGILALLIGIFWTYMQVFVKKQKKNKKAPLKENIIYNHSDDVIEESFKKKVKLKK